jgi:hypothetical protein
MSLAQEFSDWKKHPITKRVFDGLKEQGSNLAEELIYNAGVDPARDRFLAGYLAAQRDFYLIQLEDEDTE